MLNGKGDLVAGQDFLTTQHPPSFSLSEQWEEGSASRTSWLEGSVYFQLSERSILQIANYEK